MMSKIGLKLRYHVWDRAAWQCRKLPFLGSYRGNCPSGRMLLRKDLGSHPSIRYSEIYPEGRIAFSPLELPQKEREFLDLAERADDWANEIHAGFVASVKGGRMIWPDFVVTPEDDFYAELRFPHVSYQALRDVYALRHPTYGRPQRYSGRALVLHSTNNLYHSMFEAVARVAMAREAGCLIGDFDWFLNGEVRSSFEHVLFEQLGVPADKYLPKKKQGGHLEFDELIFSNTTYGINRRLCEMIKGSLKGLAPRIPDIGLPKKIYLSRGANYSTRKLINEREVMELLVKAGYVVVYPHLYSLAEQRALFESADSIVSLHGAALANLLWCNPGTRVIELRNRNHVRGYWKLYWNLGSVMGLDYHWLCCVESELDDRGESPQYRNFSAPMDVLSGMI